ncbi:MAG: SHOCT domain-containing protein [Actinomycetia bacterium]|nr:SHOCT domain-containing protein [Actinomycetes bacterium]
MNFWQLVMLMAWLAFFVVFVWAVVSVFVDVIRREDVSGPQTVGWILLVLFVPLIGILIYVATRPKLSREEQSDVDAYEQSVRSDGVSVAERIADLARLHEEGALTDEEYAVLKAEAIG